MTVHVPFDNSYARLPAHFFARVEPTPVRSPRLVKVNAPLARDLGLDPQALSSAEGVEILAGLRVPEGAEPIAMAYAGHQFGQFVPQLGDGRAILLGEVIDRAGRRLDIQLKGSGPTPFSRRGDGRAALGPVLREYLVSEAMAALGIPTTRALAAVTTGEMVARDTFLPGAVLTRVAASHVRVGTFQFFAARGDVEGLRRLADYVIARHDPDLADAPDRYRRLLDAVVARQAALVAQWMNVGFIHGVMNTDNMAVSGETIDYGPCAFMDAYDPDTVFSSIDHGGRYAYANQPVIAQWNLARLAECLLTIIAPTPEEALPMARESIAAFGDRFEEAHLAGLRRKLGLREARDGDAALARDLLERMAAGTADFTLAFRNLCDAAADPTADGAVRDLFIDPTSYDSWAVNWRARLDEEGGDAQGRRNAMRQVNPAIIPRNHRVEAAIEAAVQRGDLGPFEALHAALSAPFDDAAGPEDFTSPPPPDQRVYRTFCGT